MRSLVALMLTATPALAHSGAALHHHEAEGFWIAAAAFAVGMTLTLGVALRAARAAR